MCADQTSDTEDMADFRRRLDVSFAAEEADEDWVRQRWLDDSEKRGHNADERHLRAKQEADAQRIAAEEERLAIEWQRICTARHYRGS